MKNIIRWFKRQYFKTKGIHGTLWSHRVGGKFRVLYSDGRKSQPFSYKTAKDYAEMFDGKVIDNF